MIEGKGGRFASFLRFLLLVLARIYAFILVVRGLFYKTGLFSQKTLSVPVISIGNITAGGTGKTSLVLLTARWLQEKGKKVTVLNRGYKRRSKNKIMLVSDGKKITEEPEKAGDEPYLLACRLSGVGVVVGKNRYQSGLFALKQLQPQAIILDDGFQHLKIKRDLDLLMIDATNPFSNGYLLPRGLLREPLSRIKRADLIVLNRVNQTSPAEKEKIKIQLRFLNPEADLVECQYVPDYLYSLEEKKPREATRSISFIKGKSIIVLSSIGNPLSFEKTLDELGAKIEKHFCYPDHHWYRVEELERVLGYSGDNLIITTEKDAVHIPLDTRLNLSSVYVLKMQMEIVEGLEVWQKRIQQLLS